MPGVVGAAVLMRPFHSNMLESVTSKARARTHTGGGGRVKRRKNESCSPSDCINKAEMW